MRSAKSCQEKNGWSFGNWPKNFTTNNAQATDRDDRGLRAADNIGARSVNFGQPSPTAHSVKRLFRLTPYPKAEFLEKSSAKRAAIVLIAHPSCAGHTVCSRRSSGASQDPLWRAPDAPLRVAGTVTGRLVTQISRCDHAANTRSQRQLTVSRRLSNRMLRILKQCRC